MKKIIIIINIVLIAVQFVITSIKSGDGKKISSLTNQVQELQAENRNLNLLISKNASLDNIKEKIASGGFVPLTLQELAPLPVAMASGHE